NQKGGSLRIFRETVRASRFPLLESLRGHRVSKLVGTGGNIEALASLNSAEAHKDDSVRKAASLSVPRLRSVMESLARLTPDERVKRYDLRPDRADVIVPASAVFEYVAKRTRVARILVPFTGLVE